MLEMRRRDVLVGGFWAGAGGAVLGCAAGVGQASDGVLHAVDHFELTEGSRWSGNSWPEWLIEAYRREIGSPGGAHPMWMHSLRRGDDFVEFRRYMDDDAQVPLVVVTPWGNRVAFSGDWIVLGSGGELDVWKQV